MDESSTKMKIGSAKLKDFGDKRFQRRNKVILYKCEVNTFYDDHLHQVL